MNLDVKGSAEGFTSIVRISTHSVREQHGRRGKYQREARVRVSEKSE